MLNRDWWEYKNQHQGLESFNLKTPKFNKNRQRFYTLQMYQRYSTQVLAGPLLDCCHGNDQEAPWDCTCFSSQVHKSHFWMTVFKTTSNYSQFDSNIFSNTDKKHLSWSAFYIILDSLHQVCKTPSKTFRKINSPLTSMAPSKSRCDRLFAVTEVKGSVISVSLDCVYMFIWRSVLSRWSSIFFLCAQTFCFSLQCPLVLKK